MLWMTGQKQVPVLVLGGRAIPDSTAIITALTPGGVLVVDDMIIVPDSADDEHRANQERVRWDAAGARRPGPCELAVSSGIMIASRRR
jgi:hypothetical protein